MDNLDMSLLTTNKKELQKIHGDETKKLQENEFKMDLLKRLTIEDFPQDLTANSKKNIEKALLAVKIRDHIGLGGGQKLLGLDDFEISNITLSYLEKKLIRERFEHLIALEKKKMALAQPDPEDELIRAQNTFLELQRINMTLNETLADLKQKELELLKEVAELIASPVQKTLVQGILDDAKIVNLQMKSFVQVIQESETTRTQHAKKAFAEISSAVDDRLKGKEN